MKMSQSSTERLERHSVKGMQVGRVLAILMTMFITIMIIGGLLSKVDTEAAMEYRYEQRSSQSVTVPFDQPIETIEP